MLTSTSIRWLVVAVSAAILLFLAAACGTETVEVPGETVVVEKEVIKTVEVPGETVVVERVVTETVEVPGETVVVEKEVVKTVEIPVAAPAMMSRQVVTPDRWGGTLRIAMTAADVPRPDLSSSEGGEDYRWVSFQINNGLTVWDWGRGDPGGGVPPILALAESYELDQNDQRKWTFELKKGLKFHDGMPINSEAVIVSYDRQLKDDSPYYSVDLRRAPRVCPATSLKATGPSMI